MKKNYPLLLVFLFLFSGFGVQSQSFDPFIEGIIEDTNLDSLVSYVRVLSGEDSVTINGERHLIKSRSSFQNSDRELSGDYLLEKLQSFGLPVQEHIYSNSGRNILGIQQGVGSPDKEFIICAHYDAVTDYAADDNASGTAAVLEAARLLSQYELPCTIIYALWDEEEIGLIGSEEYALEAALNGQPIDGVINMDMIAWDGDNDMVLELHSHSVGNSESITDILVEVNDIYDLSIVPSVITPGTPYSDHSSFWNQNYGAVLLIEEYWGGDFNPYYHTVGDRIDLFNMEFFHASSRLAIASLATMANNNPVTDIRPQSENGNYQVQNYPNPFSTNTTLAFTQQQPSQVDIYLLDGFGKKIKTILRDNFAPGQHEVNISADELCNGLHFVVIQSSTERRTHKIMVSK